MAAFSKCIHDILSYTNPKPQNVCLIFAWTANIFPYRHRSPPCWLMVITADGNCRPPVKSPASRLLTQLFFSGAGQRKHQSSASLAFVRKIHQWSVNSPHKGPVTRKMFPFDDVIMIIRRRSILPYPSPLVLYIHWGMAGICSTLAQLTSHRICPLDKKW